MAYQHKTRAANAAGLAELESEKAKRERARKAREHGGKATPEQIQDRLATTPTAKRSESKPRTPRTIEKAAKSAGVSERKVRQAQEDKRDMARRIYHTTPERERTDKKRHLANILSVPERTIRDWLSRIDKDTKEARNKRIFDLWLACYTQEEIAEREGVSGPRVREILAEMANLPKPLKAAADLGTMGG